MHQGHTVSQTVEQPSQFSAITETRFANDQTLVRWFKNQSRVGLFSQIGGGLILCWSPEVNHFNIAVLGIAALLMAT